MICVVYGVNNFERKRVHFVTGSSGVTYKDTSSVSLPGEFLLDTVGSSYSSVTVYLPQRFYQRRVVSQKDTPSLTLGTDQ